MFILLICKQCELNIHTDGFSLKDTLAIVRPTLITYNYNYYLFLFVFSLICPALVFMKISETFKRFLYDFLMQKYTV